MKPSYHQSRLKHYLKCPKMFQLSKEYSADIGTSTQMAMREGELFEGYVFGFKPDKDEAALIGKKKTQTIDQIKVHANWAKNLFKSGNPYVKLHHERPEYDLDGEADHIGELNWEFIGKLFPGAQWEKESINDLKYTGAIDYGNVGLMDTAYDYFQALQYVSIHYLNTGKILPFIYLVVEGNYIDPLLRLEKVFIHESDIEQKFLPFVDKVHNDLFYESKASYETCLGGRRGSRCWFLQFCTKGREFAGGYKIVEFPYLPFEVE